MELIYIALIAGAVLICIVFGLYACQQLSQSYNSSSNSNATYSSDQSYRVVYPRARTTATATAETDSSDISYLELERARKEAEKEKEKRDRLEHFKNADIAEQNKRRMHYEAAVAVGGNSDYYQDSSGRFV